ncbi:uncharacterized protein LOC129595254 [Paramacrobiotus metropolitanus]|uniref:uncharacterized protein LOC129595254 n=1 Tax=Paramacrobiotus metropolitanus TaxID=2943436 RepID=UPI00244566F2|nr:uncharacterized protein LOC129595254 [Paramacrobiotus metropolitanus]
MGRLADVFALIFQFSVYIAAAVAFDTTTSTTVITTHGVSGVCMDGLPCTGEKECGSPLYCRCSFPAMRTSINNTGICSPVTHSPEPVAAATTYRLPSLVSSTQKSVLNGDGPTGNQSSPLAIVPAQKGPYQNALSAQSTALDGTGINGSPGNQTIASNMRPVNRDTNHNANRPSGSSSPAGDSGRQPNQQDSAQHRATSGRVRAHANAGDLIRHRPG